MYYFFLVALFSIPALAGAQEFVPLTTFPGFDEVKSSSQLTAFLNQLYQVCVGAAAVLAVLQIFRAGIMYMGGDSITETKKARELIVMSILGLLLVLSPVIVFQIINPDILSLRIDTSKLKLEGGSGQSTVRGSAGNDRLAGSPTTQGATRLQGEYVSIVTQSPGATVFQNECVAKRTDGQAHRYGKGWCVQKNATTGACTQEIAYCTTPRSGITINMVILEKGTETLEFPLDTAAGSHKQRFDSFNRNCAEAGAVLKTLMAGSLNYMRANATFGNPKIIGNKNTLCEGGKNTLIKNNQIPADGLIPNGWRAYCVDRSYSCQISAG